MTKEEYDKLIPYKPIIDLFMRSGSYVGGGDGLFDLMGVTQRNCANCLSKALIQANDKIKEYERTM